MPIGRASGLFLSPGSQIDKSLADVAYTSGAPDAPVVTVDGGGQVSWTSVSGSGGSATSYRVEIFPSGPTVSISGTNATISGYTSGVTYSVRVWGINPAGRGKPSKPAFFTPIYNSASGGNSVATVTNYNGTGETWKVHTFTTNGTFQVNNALNPFRVLVVGGGGGGGGGAVGGGGGAGGVIANNSQTLTAGSHSVSIGSGGGNDTSGGNTVLGPLTAIGGGKGGRGWSGAGGNGGSGGGSAHGWGGGGGPGGTGTSGQGFGGGTGGDGNAGQPSGGGGGAGGAGSRPSGGAGITTTITGSSITLAGGGGGGARCSGGGGAGQAGAGNGGAACGCCSSGGSASQYGSGGGGAGFDSSGGSGFQGIVYVAYRIG